MLTNVQKIIANQMSIDPDTVTPEKRLEEDLKADSLDVVALVMDLEQEFSIEIPDEALVEIKTVGDILAYLENNLPKA